MSKTIKHAMIDTSGKIHVEYYPEPAPDADKAEALVERLIEAGEPFITYSKLQGDYDKVLLRHHLERWNAIIAEWEHRNDKPEGE